MKTTNKDISIDELIDCIEFYLSETVDNLTDWDCEHLAFGLLESFEIKNKKNGK